MTVRVMSSSMRRNNVSATGDHHQQQQQHAEDDSNTNKKDERQGGGGEAPQQQQQKTRHFKQHSHGNIARSAHFHSHDDDEVDSAPPVILTNSPGTPPKKVWEKSYHKFLTLHRRGGAGGGSTTAGAAAAGDTNNNNTRTRHHHHHQQQHSASSPSTLALTAAETCSTSSSNFSQHTSISQQQQQQPQQALQQQQQQQQQQSSLTPKGLMSRTIMTTSTRLAVKQQRQSGESTTLQHQDDSSAPPLSPSPPAAISVPGGTAVAFKEAHDSSVRGGNFFSQVFRSSSGGTTTSPSSQHSHGGSNKPHRKIKSIISVSSDELDGTLRRGAQKSSYCSSSSSNSHGGSHQTLAAISATAAAATGTSFTRGEGSGSGSRGGRGTTRQRTTSTDSYGQHQHHHQQQQQQKLQHSHAYQISPGGTTTTRRTASLSMGSFATSSSSLNHNNSNNNSLLLPVAPPPPPVLLQGGGGGAASAAVLQQQQKQQQRHDEQEDEDDSLLHGLLLEPPPLTTCNISARTSSASSFLAGRTFLPPVNSIIQGGAGTGGPRSLINGIVAVAPQLPPPPPPPPPPVSTITTTTTSATATADGTRNSPCGMVVTENDDDDDGNEREEEQGGTGHYDELDERVNIKPSSGGDCSSPSSFSSSPSSVAIAAVAAAAMPTSQPMTASAMKKAFTDFHNSQTTGHDGGSAYLHGGGLGDRDSSNRIFGSNGGSGGGSVANIEIAAAIGIHSDNSHHHHDSSFHKAEHLFWAAPPPTLTSVVSHGNLKQQAAGIVAAPSSFPSSASALCLESVPEHHRTDGRFDHHQQQHHRQSRILRPFNRVDSWQPGRRYLIAPAILAACPTAVWHSLGGGSSCSLSSNSGSTNDASSPFIHYRPDASPLSAQQAAVAIAENDSSNQGLFQRIVLGDCLISHGVLGAKGARSTQPSRIAAQWSSACLVLQQNYLLEFPQGTFGDKKSANASSTTTSATVAEGAATTALAAAEAASAATPSMMQHYQQQQAQPRGYAHLEFSQTFAQDDFCDALELQYYASPCAKKDLRVVLIRLSQKSAKERDGWKTCLNRAASLQMEDLYSILTRGEFEKQGGPEQQQQHYSKKGIDALSNHGHHDDKDEKVVLGKGQYSAVYPARRKDASQSIVALKVLEKNSFWKLVVKGRERADTLVREASVQATLSAKCSNLNSFLKLRGLFESSTHVVLELEYLQGTVDLFQYISSKGVLNESEAAQILSDILHSLSAMSQIGLAHRDVKPANVLMCNHSSKENTSDNCSNTKDSSSPLTRVKVCDFGMSTFVGVDGQVRGRCGTPGYVAPEIFSAGIHGGYGNQVDVFSAGVTLYVMLCGYEPFYGESDAELVENNRQAKVDFPPEEWGCVSQLAIDLVRRMMEPDPRLRPSAKEVLKHAWFQKHDATVHTPDQKKKVSNIQQQQHENDKIDDSSPDASACVIS